VSVTPQVLTGSLQWGVRIPVDTEIGCRQRLSKLALQNFLLRQNKTC